MKSYLFKGSIFRAIKFRHILAVPSAVSLVLLSWLYCNSQYLLVEVCGAWEDTCIRVTLLTTAALLLNISVKYVIVKYDPMSAILVTLNLIVSHTMVKLVSLLCFNRYDVVIRPCFRVHRKLSLSEAEKYVQLSLEKCDIEVSGETVSEIASSCATRREADARIEKFVSEYVSTSHADVDTESAAHWLGSTLSGMTQWAWDHKWYLVMCAMCIITLILALDTVGRANRDIPALRDKIAYQNKEISDVGNRIEETYDIVQKLYRIVNPDDALTPTSMDALRKMVDSDRFKTVVRLFSELSDDQLKELIQSIRLKKQK